MKIINNKDFEVKSSLGGINRHCSYTKEEWKSPKSYGGSRKVDKIATLQRIKDQKPFKRRDRQLGFENCSFLIASRGRIPML